MAETEAGYSQIQFLSAFLLVILNQLFFRCSSVSKQKFKFQFFSAILLFLKKRKRLIFPRISLTIFFTPEYFLLIKLSPELH